MNRQDKHIDPHTQKRKWQSKQEQTSYRVWVRAREREREGEMKLLTDGDFTIGALEHLVHALGSERGPEDPSDGFASGNVGFLSIEASQSGLLLLLPQYYEWPPILIECERHFHQHTLNFTISLRFSSPPLPTLCFLLGLGPSLCLKHLL